MEKRTQNYSVPDSKAATIAVVVGVVLGLILLSVLAYPIGGVVVVALLWLVVPIAAIYLHSRRDRDERPSSRDLEARRHRELESPGPPPRQA